MKIDPNNGSKEFGMDKLISRVALKAAITEEAASIAVDIVVAAVKEKLPPPMAEKLVQVLAGEDDYSSPIERATRRVTHATDSVRDNSARLLRETEDRMREIAGSVKGFFKPDGDK